MEYTAASQPSPDGRRPAGFSVSRPAALILSLMSVLGLLCLPFGRAGSFAGVAVLVLSLCVCLLAGRKGVIAALLVPAYLIVLMSGDFTFPAMAVGTAICSSSLAFLCFGGKRGIAASFVSFAAAAVIALAVTGSVFEASLLLVPAAGWAALWAVFGKKSYSSSLLILSASLLAALCVSVLIGLYVDTPTWMKVLIPAEGESAPELWRSLISDRLMSIRTPEGSFTDRATADTAAVLAVNTLPGTAALAAELIALVQYSLTVSLYHSTGKEGTLPRDSLRLSVTPLCAVLFVVISLTSAICASSRDGEFLGTVLDNLNLVLSPLFLIIGVRFVYVRLCRRFAAMQNGRSFAFILILIAAAVSLNLFIAAAVICGVAASLIPAARRIRGKIGKH